MGHWTRAEYLQEITGKQPDEVLEIVTHDLLNRINIVVAALTLSELNLPDGNSQEELKVAKAHSHDILEVLAACLEYRKPQHLG